jgi:hypothetical protein
VPGADGLKLSFHGLGRVHVQERAAALPASVSAADEHAVGVEQIAHGEAR